MQDFADVEVEEKSRQQLVVVVAKWGGSTPSKMVILVDMLDHIPVLDQSVSLLSALH
jgi:hypothetical protein